MNEVFKGTTAECLSHLGKHIGENKIEKVKVIAVFCGTHYRTVEKWLEGKHPPIGENLVRMRVYLEHIGYSVTELLKLNPVVRDAARLCAFRVVPIAEIAEMVGYAGRKTVDSGRNTAVDAILGIFRGVQGVGKDRLVEFEALVSVFKDMLPEKVQQTPKIDLADHVKSQIEHEQVVVRTVPPAGTTFRPKLAFQRTLDTHTAIIESFASTIKGLIPLAQLLESDEFTPAERAHLRELLGGDGVFEFANSFYRLCGERTRKQHPAIKEQSR
jgi:hypothetical protein